jgi:hypothetical protein
VTLQAVLAQVHDPFNTTLKPLDPLASSPDLTDRISFPSTPHYPALVLVLSDGNTALFDSHHRTH